jgi:phage shock protein PspC (stress-responsive transcriptional regulator)
VALVLTVTAGLSLSRLWHGSLSGEVGDALYAVMVYLLVALLVPKARTAAVGGAALGICVIIELAQLTGVPATLVRAWWPARYVLGTTFQALDLVAYAVGAVCVCVLDRASARPANALRRTRSAHLGKVP